MRELERLQALTEQPIQQCYPCPKGIDVGEVLIAWRELVAAQEGYRREDCTKLRGELRGEPGETGTCFFPEEA
jgi:heterodisulfide reductase subunit C